MSASLSGLESLRGQVAVVTGGARGQGAAEVELLHELGASVVAVDVLDDDGRALVERLGGGVAYHHLDVRDGEAWGELVEHVVDEHGRLDVLVNNAGVFTKRPLDEWPEDDLRAVLDVNLLGPILAIQAVAPAMGPGSAIVNVSSTAGVRGYGAALPYSASKWGLRGVSRSAAQALGPRGIRVNCVCPGAIDTAMYDPTAMDVTRLPLGRVGTSQEVAAAVAYLASDASGYCTGTELVVDGGANA